MKKIFFLPMVLVALFASAQNGSNEIALVISPLKLDEASNYQLLYRRDLEKNLVLRFGGRFFVETVKSTRSDTISSNSGSIQYDLSAGIQKNLDIDGLNKIYLYAALDGYWNSEFNRKEYETYYGYYWNFGLKPIAGIAYEPFDNIRLSLESKADLNINLQQYSAPGANKDNKYSFFPFRQLGVSLGYLF